MKPMKDDYNKPLIRVTVILLRGADLSYFTFDRGTKYYLDFVPWREGDSKSRLKEGQIRLN